MQSFDKYKVKQNIGDVVEFKENLTAILKPVSQDLDKIVFTKWQFKKLWKLAVSIKSRWENGEIKIKLAQASSTLYLLCYTLNT